MQTLQQHPVTALERERDQLAARIERLTHERDPHTVEGFAYNDAAKARKVRGRLLCACLRRIDAVNGEICKRIAPSFAPSASVGFSDRVMQSIPTTAHRAPRGGAV